MARRCSTIPARDWWAATASRISGRSPAQASTRLSSDHFFSTRLPRARPAIWPRAFLATLAMDCTRSARASRAASSRADAPSRIACHAPYSSARSGKVERRPLPHLGGRQGAEGAGRVAGREHEIARLHAAHAGPQKPLGAQRHVLPGRPGRQPLAIRPDPQQGKVTGVARPHPVVDLATEVAERPGRGVDQPHVRVLQALDQHVLEPAVERRHPAAPPGLPLALRHQLLLALGDGVGAGEPIGPGRHRLLDICRHIGEAGGHQGRRPVARAARHPARRPGSPC